MMRKLNIVLIFGFACLISGCRSTPDEFREDLPGSVQIRDVTFYSQALGRKETYRMMARRTFAPGDRLHVVYLLHGNGGSYRDWSGSAPLASYAARNFVFIMPEGHASYFMNSATFQGDRYEDFITGDLVAEAERTLPADRDRSIAGVSMGGFGALVLAFRHPQLYVVAGALSPPVDVPRRAFTLRRPLQSASIRGIFGAHGSAERDARDPFVLARKAEVRGLPFIYLGSGKEPLSEPIRRFDALLTQRQIPHESHTQPGGHDWGEWNRHVPALFAVIERGR